MGCDIHLYVETLQDGQWKPYKGEWPNPDYDPADEWGAKQKPILSQYRSPYSFEPDTPINEFSTETALSEEVTYVYPSFYNGRNYDLFSILADVRNGYGFAGVPTGSHINPISDPKGLPDDVSHEVYMEAKKWGRDGHSHSWLTLRELQEYDWNQAKVHVGIVDVAEYATFKAKGAPTSWSGGVHGPNVKEVSNKEMDDIFRKLQSGEMTIDPDSNEFQLLIGGIHYITRITWPETYRESAGYFYTHHLPLLASFGDPDSVRLVFWFDN